MWREQDWKFFASFKFTSNPLITLDLWVITDITRPGHGDYNGVSDDRNEKYILELEYISGAKF